MRQKRVVIGLCLLSTLLAGLWFLKAMIVYDLARMFLWQQVLFWFSDICSIALIVNWMLTPETNSGLIGNAVSGRTLAIGLVVSLFIDVGVTGLALHSSSQGMNRAVEAKADLLSVTESNFGQTPHYRFNISFDDPSGKNIRTHLALSLPPGEPIQQWKDEPLSLIGIDQQENKKLTVVYDPQLSRRVWFKDQEFGSTTGIAVLFSVIHILQIIIVFASASGLYQGGEVLDSESYQLYPVAAEAILLFIFGLILHQP